VQTRLNDNVLNVIKYPLDIVLVGGARAVGINVLIRQALVLGLKLLLNEPVAFIKVRSGAIVFREAVRQRLFQNLLFEQIPFI